MERVQGNWTAIELISFIFIKSPIMEGNYYPHEIIDNSVEYHLARNSLKSQAIYIIVIMVFFLAIASLPFVYINVTVQGTGIIRPISERTEVKALAQGNISNIFIKEGDFIKVGDTLLIIKSEKLNSQSYFLQKQKQEYNNYISDLKKLVILKASTFSSEKYQGEYYKFKDQITLVKTKRAKAKRELDRNKPLYDGLFISKKEYDDLLYQYKLADNDYNVTVTNQLSIWKSDLSRYKSSLRDIESQQEQIQKEQDFYIVKAPVSGTVEQFSGVYPGTIIQAGQVITSISPETDLIAEVYVSPKDIGYLNEGSKLNLQVDAFNYNDWGMLKGEISDISGDYILIENQPVFKIKCELEEYQLQLKNGITGNLKKGMTVQARFLLAERSLYQLLFDNVNDWLNPTQNDY